MNDEIPRNWRLKNWRYGLRATIQDNEMVINDVPTGIRDFIEEELAQKNALIMINQMSEMVPA